jgi:hypothetical protein
MKRQWLALLAAFLVGVGAYVVFGDGGGPTTPGTTVEVGSGQEAVVPPAVAEQAEESVHDNLRAEVPEGVPLEDVLEAQDQQERLAESDQLPLVTPDAAPEQRGCATRTASNRSSRRGVRPRLFVLHYTVSPNRAGLSDMNAVQSLANRASAQVSWTYLIDHEGHCYYAVPESQKPWTQATFNPVSISVEVINTGRESSYAGREGLRKLALVVSDSTRRWDIPLQLGRVSGCTVTRAGVIDHRRLGACGGGHTDIEPPYSVEQVLRAAQRARGVNRKLVKWQRSHRIAHAKVRQPGCSGNSYCGRHYRSRNRKLHRLIVREGGTP